MKIVIETQRLLLREFTIDDAKLIYDLNSIPEVVQYTGDPIISLEKAREKLEKSILPQYVLYNHGRWAVFVKDRVEFIGWCGLKTRPERNEIDLGYRFKPCSWGKGYATEAADACLKYGFETLKHDRIVGRAMPSNVGSLRVLEKIGMQYLCDEVVDGHSANTYELYNPFVR